MIITTHQIWIQDGLVHLANEQDSYYVERFHSRDDVDEFIQKLENARDEAFPLTSNEKLKAPKAAE